MMKLLVLVALALSCPFLHAIEEEFTLTAGVVDSLAIVVDENYKGYVDFTFTALDIEDVTVCINWLVPAEAPEDVTDLAATWNQTCTYSHVFLAGSGVHNATFPLRSSINWVSASLVSDVFSDGVGETFIFRWTYSFENCTAPDTTGPNCLPVQTIDYENDTESNEFGLFRLASYVDQPDVFIRYLNFESNDNASVTYRLNAPVLYTSETDYAYDGYCAKISACKIQIPPFTSVSGFFWNINVTGSATFQIVAVTCGSGKMGVNCTEKYTTFKNKPGDPLSGKGKQSFVFNGTELYVAVGGLDGYTQDEVAPPILVQVDQLPTKTFFLSSGINSKANRLGFDLNGIANNQTRFVVTVLADDDTSYGIWTSVNATSSQCPLDCSGRGACIDYVCQCNDEDKYNGLGCEHEIKEFTIEYIILIAVGGLLVLSIVIGVPIYCWMNRQQDYETIE